MCRMCCLYPKFAFFFFFDKGQKGLRCDAVRFLCFPARSERLRNALIALHSRRSRALGVHMRDARQDREAPRQAEVERVLAVRAWTRGELGELVARVGVRQAPGTENQSSPQHGKRTLQPVN